MTLDSLVVIPDLKGDLEKLETAKKLGGKNSKYLFFGDIIGDVFSPNERIMHSQCREALGRDNDFQNRSGELERLKETRKEHEKFYREMIGYFKESEKEGQLYDRVHGEAEKRAKEKLKNILNKFRENIYFVNDSFITEEAAKENSLPLLDKFGDKKILCIHGIPLDSELPEEYTGLGFREDSPGNVHEADIIFANNFDSNLSDALKKSMGKIVVVPGKKHCLEELGSNLVFYEAGISVYNVNRDNIEIRNYSGNRINYTDINLRSGEYGQTSEEIVPVKPAAETAREKSFFDEHKYEAAMIIGAGLSVMACLGIVYWNKCKEIQKQEAEMQRFEQGNTRNLNETFK